jgi:hypothetical protein
LDIHGKSPLAKGGEAGAGGLDGRLGVFCQATPDKSGGGREARKIAGTGGFSRLDNDRATLGALAHQAVAPLTANIAAVSRCVIASE